MTKTITVEGDLATVDAVANLTTQGSVSAPVRTVPGGFSKIKKIICAVSADAAAAGSGTYLLRLGGAAVKNGEQTIIVGAQGNTAVQAGSDQAPGVNTLVELEDVDIDVSPFDAISIQGEMMGSDLGTARMAVTLVFE